LQRIADGTKISELAPLRDLRQIKNIIDTFPIREKSGKLVVNDIIEAGVRSGVADYYERGRTGFTDHAYTTREAATVIPLLRTIATIHGLQALASVGIDARAPLWTVSNPTEFKRLIETEECLQVIRRTATYWQQLGLDDLVHLLAGCIREYDEEIGKWIVTVLGEKPSLTRHATFTLNAQKNAGLSKRAREVQRGKYA
jgi:hypothetical protein